ncbi:MAG: hypothetical protein U1B78_03040, partial [Dehalococcoidia bacterium]|nr:hypothetical protein [Dehalococcoidia bacterium]
MRQALARFHAWLYLALLVGACLLGAWAISLATPVPSTDEFNVIRWELTHLPNKWLYLTGRFLRGGLSPAEEDERLGRYLLLTARIRQLDPDALVDGPAVDDQLARLTRERDARENDVEAIIEGRLTSLLDDLDLDSSVPLFPGARWVFPPVDVE